MSIRFEFVTKKCDNPQMEKDMAIINATDLTRLRQAKRLLRGIDSPNLSEDFKELIRQCKSNLKHHQDNLADKRFIKAVSDLKWKFYSGEYNDEYGVTKYSKEPVEITLSQEIPYVHGKATIQQIKDLREQATARVREERRKRKEIPFEEREFVVKDNAGNPLPVKAKYKVYAGGGHGREEYNQNSNFNIHIESGEIMRLKAENNLRKVFENKKPETEENHVGVEIEYISKKDKYDMAKLLVKYGVQDFVTLKEDGSLRKEDGFPYTHELCVVAPESKIRSVIKAALEALNESGCRVNRRCGLHVHIDVRNRDKDVVFSNLVKSQKILFAMNPVSRLSGEQADGSRDTAWSKKMEYSDFQEAINNIGGDRYFGINPLSFSRHKTIEVRMHSGSTNFEKIWNWVTILVGIASSTKTYKSELTKPESFCERYEFNDVLLTYIKERIAKFKDKDGKHITIDEVA